MILIGLAVGQCYRELALIEYHTRPFMMMVRTNESNEMLGSKCAICPHVPEVISEQRAAS